MVEVVDHSDVFVSRVITNLIANVQPFLDESDKHHEQAKEHELGSNRKGTDDFNNVND